MENKQMETKDKANWGSPTDWGTAIGALIAVIGLLMLISGVWTPDAASSAGTGNTIPAIITLVIGIVVIVVAQIFKRRAG